MQISSLRFSLNTNYQQSKSELAQSMTRMATGDKFSTSGEFPAAHLSMSERFRNQIKSASASTESLQSAASYLDQTEAYSQTAANILNRMVELATTGADSLKLDVDRASLEQEFQSLKTELTAISRDSQYFGKQTIGQGVVLTYDASQGKMSFTQPNGGDQKTIDRNFGANAIDAVGTSLGFSSSENYTMSRDGKSLFYMGMVTGDPAGKVRIKRYDIDSERVTSSTQTFDTGDKLFVDEQGQLFANGNGTLYNVRGDTLQKTATPLADLRPGQAFSVYKGQAVYSRSADNSIVSADVSLGTATVLATTPTFALGGVNQAISSSGKYVADVVANGQIRVLDTRTGNSSTLILGATATSVDKIQFSADGERIYYINKDTNSINDVAITTDPATGAVSLSAGRKVVQGSRSNSLNGLSTGGANNGSSIDYLLSEGSNTKLSYGAIDLSLYNLGLANTHIDTFADSTAAIDDVKTAMNKLSAQRAKTGAMASRFDMIMNSHLQFISNLSTAEGQIRNVDIAKESIRVTNNEVLMSSAQAIISQFNTLSKNVLALLGTA